MLQHCSALWKSLRTTEFNVYATWLESFVFEDHSTLRAASLNQGSSLVQTTRVLWLSTRLTRLEPYVQKSLVNQGIPGNPGIPKNQENQALLGTLNDWMNQAYRAWTRYMQKPWLNQGVPGKPGFPYRIEWTL